VVEMKERRLGWRGMLGSGGNRRAGEKIRGAEKEANKGVVVGEGEYQIHHTFQKDRAPRQDSCTLRLLFNKIGVCNQNQFPSFSRQACSLFCSRVESYTIYQIFLQL
jgi:hypothetical protein